MSETKIRESKDELSVAQESGGDSVAAQKEEIEAGRRRVNEAGVNDVGSKGFRSVSHLFQLHANLMAEFRMRQQFKQLNQLSQFIPRFPHSSTTLPSPKHVSGHFPAALVSNLPHFGYPIVPSVF